MNKKLIACFILVLGFLTVGQAQNDSKIRIQGTVVDGRTGEPIAFANLGVLGTVLGVASDMDGSFELVVPYKCATYKIRVSAIGYTSVELKVYEVRDKPDLKIKLKPTTYGIKEVDVYGELLVYKKMLQNVVSNIGKNYIASPYQYDGYFKYVTSRGETEKVKEATVTIYDAGGYHRDNPETAFREVNYKYNEVRRSEPASSILDGLTCLDDILVADIVRNTRNVLDIINSRDYKLKSKGKTVYEGDSVQIIAYTAVNPSISTTGDPAVTGYSGEIYINLKDFAVMKNVTTITSRDFNALGRNLVVVNEKPKSDVTMTMTTVYKKLKSVYFLSGVNIDYSYQEEGEEVKGKMEFVTTQVNFTNPTAIKGRIYYEDIPENERFWNQYSAYFQE